MQTELLWNELLRILNQLQIEIRWSAGDFRGGLYSSRGIQRLLLNEGYPKEWQVKIICQELARVDLSRFYIPPAIRDSIAIHQGWEQRGLIPPGESHEDGQEHETCSNQ